MFVLVAFNSFENNKIETRHAKALYITNGFTGGIWHIVTTLR